MLPNHSPLVIAEQFGTLATLHPGRIDLGLGRAPGSDQATMRRAAPRPSSPPNASPRTSSSCRACSATTARSPGVSAIPGQGTHVPLYILGSSLFGAQLAARAGPPLRLRLALRPARPARRAARSTARHFKPSEQLAEPYVIAGVGVIAADDQAEAERAARGRPAASASRASSARGGGKLTDEEVDADPRLAAGRRAVDEMLTYTGVGTGRPRPPPTWTDFQEQTGADELITVHYATRSPPGSARSSCSPRPSPRWRRPVAGRTASRRGRRRRASARRRSGRPRRRTRAVVVVGAALDERARAAHELRPGSSSAARTSSST